jgi:hypothetical protein
LEEDIDIDEILARYIWQHTPKYTLKKLFWIHFWLFYLFWYCILLVLMN